jgi:hypothetical protein
MVIPMKIVFQGRGWKRWVLMRKLNFLGFHSLLYQMMKIDGVVKIHFLLDFVQNIKVLFVLFQDDSNHIDSVDLTHPLIHHYCHRKTLYFGLKLNHIKLGRIHHFCRLWIWGWRICLDLKIWHHMFDWFIVCGWR